MNLTQRLCLVCLTSVVLLIIVGLGKIALFMVDIGDQESCSELVYQAVSSPRGQHLAQIVTVGCDRPNHRWAAGAAPDGKDKTVFKFSESPAAIRLSVAWAGEMHLVIERLCVDGYLSWAIPEWRNITISYRCLDHHREQHRPGASGR